ncbi:MAG: ATP synthase F1 subunit gamma [Candidatus Levyibacteriota bacterium]|nr:MAG: ATP synthase F1 subunit gamma [Candidatus Levybacteria bacterium]
MASILILKRRITAAQNVSKTTKAMQMIAASKMKRAQDATLASRPYVQSLTALSAQLAKYTGSDETSHPYLKQRSLTNKTLVIVLSPDKGLCGGLITNLLREFLRYGKTQQNVAFITVGKKLEMQVTHQKKEIIASFVFGNTTPTFDMVFPVTRIIENYYLSGKVDNVKIIGTHFTSIFTQTPKITTILPLQVPQEEKEEAKNPYIFEPDQKTLMTPLLNHYLEMAVYQHFLESFVSEQAARMISMQNATDNANSIIEDLKLEYNKTRQAKITNEILDITGANTM